MTSSMHEEILVLTVILCGVVCVGGYLLTFALSRRLAETATRPMIGLGELIKPLAYGMLLGLVILAYRLTGEVDAVARTAALAVPQLPALLSALLSVGLVGVCSGGWAARLRVGRTPIAAADLVRRLCIAGNTHEDATARVAVRVALAAGYDSAGASDLLAAASLHDVGRAGIPKAILNKQGALDAAERRVLQNHTRIGHRMLARSHEPMLDLAADIALHHHERWDGSGYPTGLSEERIPLTSRAIALAETFDSLLSKHSGQAAASSGRRASDQGEPDPPDPKALDEVARCLRESAGVQLDPRLVALLLADLPGMIAARNGHTTTAHAACGPAARPVSAWLRPSRFRALSGGIAT